MTRHSTCAVLLCAWVLWGPVAYGGKDFQPERLQPVSGRYSIVSVLVWIFTWRPTP